MDSGPECESGNDILSSSAVLSVNEITVAHTTVSVYKLFHNNEFSVHFTMIWIFSFPSNKFESGITILYETIFNAFILF